MKDARKTAPGVGSTGSGNGQLSFAGFELSISDFTTPAPPRQVEIERFLLFGREKARSVAKLKRITKLHPRESSRTEQDAQRRGMASTEVEKQRHCRSLRHRAKELYETLYCREHSQGEENDNGT